MSLAAETMPLATGQLGDVPPDSAGDGDGEERRRAEPQPSDPGHLTSLSRPGEPSVIAFSDLLAAVAGLVGGHFVDLSCSHGVQLGTEDQRGGDTCL